MIKITIPNNNINERKYILETIFNDFLDIEFILKFENIDIWKIELNNKTLIFKDSFFNKFPNNKEYLEDKNIPKKVNFTTNKFIVEEDIPIIFGDETLNIEENKIVCGIDIFASSFFMLSRWEEYVNKNRDKHNRFPAYESLAFKNNFLNRAVVNEYIEMLKNMLLNLDNSLKFKEYKYELIVTHDVDMLYRWMSFKQVLRIVLGDLIKRKKLKLALNNLKEYFFKDPYDNYDYLMDISESISVKSHFYFMSGGVTNYDNRYNIKSKKVKKLIKKIKKRGHNIGIHPSFNSYNNKNLLEQELKTLEEVTKESIKEGRQHYLRFEVPTTWQIWNDLKMKIDSSCGYADCEGFRCGIGEEFFVFNILTQEKLKLKERPLLYMDDNRLEGERVLNEKDLIFMIKNIKKISIKYNTKCTILFHQNIFASKEVNYREVYEKIN